MGQERRYGHLPTDDDLLRTLYPGLTRAQLESRCPWWKDTTSLFVQDIDGSLLVRDESPEALAKAEEQWNQNVVNNIPGLAVSPFPCMFMVRIPKGHGNPRALPGGDWEALGAIPIEVAGDRSKWDAFTFVRLNDVFDYSDFGEGWSYAAVAQAVAPDVEPHAWDIPNPRIYWPNGTVAYMQRNDRFPVGPWLQQLFKGALVNLWGDATMSNKRTDTLWAFLDHHRTRGGAPERFIEYVESLVLKPPTEFDAVLLERMRTWVKDAQSAMKRPGTTAPPPKKLVAEQWDEVRHYLHTLTKPLVDTAGNYIGGRNDKWRVIFTVRAAYAGSMPSDYAALSSILHEELPGFSITSRGINPTTTTSGEGRERQKREDFKKAVDSHFTALRSS
jgi:hypothetical protein